MLRSRLVQRHLSSRLKTLCSVTLATVSLLAGSSYVQAHSPEAAPQETVQTVQLHYFNDASALAPGVVRLNRTRNTLWATVHVSSLGPELNTVPMSELKADSVYTIWAVVFNRPNACTTAPDADVRCGPADIMAVPNRARASVFQVGVLFTDATGTANASIRLRSGSLPAGTAVLFGRGGLNDNGVFPGLHEGNGFGAEVHVVLRQHGEIDSGPGLVEQVSTANGGCAGDCLNRQAAAFPAIAK